MDLDFLLSQLNEYAMKASPESMRIATLINVRHAMLRIGKNLVGNIEEIEVDIRNGKYEIEDRVLKVEDIGLEKGRYRGMEARLGNYDLSTLVYSVTEREVSFPNMKNGKVWLLCYTFPKDEQGNIDIPTEAYQACLKYCIGETVSKMPASPYFPDRWNLKNEADSEIRIAVGLLNERTPSKLRLERHQR